jgi:hypothetical protein
MLSPLITRADRRPGWRGFPGKAFIKTGSQLPEGLIGRCACDVCHHHEPEIRLWPEHRNGAVPCADQKCNITSFPDQFMGWSRGGIQLMMLRSLGVTTLINTAVSWYGVNRLRPRTRGAPTKHARNYSLQQAPQIVHDSLAAFSCVQSADGGDRYGLAC